MARAKQIKGGEMLWEKEFDIRGPELCGKGHLACQGCGATLAMRYALKALGKKTVLALPACCWSVIAGPFPHSNLGVPLVHCAFETAAATASGIRAGLDMLGEEDVVVVAWAGDGGTFDIGLQALSGAAERNENIIYVCYDNEAYMNTGIQRSSATPFGAWTTTTPEDFPKEDVKKDIVRIMAAHRIPYIATCTVGYPRDMMNKFAKAKSIKGTRFIHCLAPCPPGWKMASDLTIRITHLAVACKVFPLFEVENGVRYTINYIPEKPVSIKEYLRLQGRFSHMTEETIRKFEQDIEDRWKRLLKDAGENQ